MEKIKYRHEYKHTMNLLDYYALKQRLRLVAKPDRHGDEDNRYRIRSLYFETPNDKALLEKLYGLPNREKFRIRLYNGNANFIKLEKKSKRNDLCNKRAAPITKEQAERIINGDIAWLKNSGEALFVELYAKTIYQGLKPKTIVDYWREAYTYPYGNVRITFDADVRTGLYSTALFAQNLPSVPVREPGLILMEVKYDQYMPDMIRDLIQTNTRKTQAFSKYAACRIYG
ncbi:MAG: polyphosphate polymerase domain-containing protein [Eubacteriales bacterium]|nr:polyphosphate polymerase domain-containing protein [Eubacteriales bacterium]